LAQLANFQFGRTNIQQMPTTPTPAPLPFVRPEPMRTAATVSRTSEMGLDWPESPAAGGFLSSGGSISVATAPAPAQVKPKLDLSIEPMAEIKSRATTQQKIEAFYGVKQIGDHVLFAARFEDARKVLIAGDFNNWSPMSTPMVNGEAPGLWVTKLPLFPGRYRYRFIVDGHWMTRPGQHLCGVESVWRTE